MITVLNLVISERKCGVMLRAPCDEWRASDGGMTILEIALKGDCIRLADNIEVRKIVNRLWYGRVNEKASNPFAVFLLRIPVIGWFLFPIFYVTESVQFLSSNAFKVPRLLIVNCIKSFQG